jgi:hypothetical protein
MKPQSRSFFPLVIIVIVLVAVSAPYLYASRMGGETYVFGGFLINPLDGNSYLAKMYQGWQGDWRYQLAFTLEPGEGAYLFLFYLFLGHLARWLNAPLLLVFHLVRLLGALTLLIVLWRFCISLFLETRTRRWAYALAALGSGVGWLLIPFGAFTADFWVAEAYPFLSAFANPHFTFGLALVLWQIIPVARRWWSRALAALLLSVINPFGVVIVLIVLGGTLGVRILLARLGRASFQLRAPLVDLVAVLLGGLPVLVYDVWVTYTDPVFAAWDAQNLTPSPPLWDTVISLSPALLFALIGAGWLIKQKRRPEGNTPSPLAEQSWLIPPVWAGLGLVLLYLPFSLQRRFMIGLYVPMAALAVVGVDALAKLRRRFRLGMILVLAVSLLTNVVVLLSGLYGARTHDPAIYLTAGEADALAWIEEHIPEDALILASPEMGMFIPAHTGRRVLYGHPFETVDAEEQEQALIGFFEAGGDDHFLSERGVDYVFFGPRERELGDFSIPGLKSVFSSDDVELYRWRDCQCD